MIISGWSGDNRATMARILQDYVGLWSFVSLPPLISLSIPFHSPFSFPLLSVSACSNTWALMASSAAGSSDLNKSSSSKKQKVTSPTSSPLGIGGTDQIGQLSSKKAGKRPRREADARHYNKKKAMLEDYKEMTIEVEKLRAECENSSKYQRLNDQKMEEVIGIMKENRSLISSLNATIHSQNQHIEFLFAKQLDLYQENDKLKNEKEYWKNLYTSQQPVDSNPYGQDIPGYSQPMPTGIGGSISQPMQPPDPSFFDDVNRYMKSLLEQ